MQRLYKARARRRRYGDIRRADSRIAVAEVIHIKGPQGAIRRAVVGTEEGQGRQIKGRRRATIRRAVARRPYGDNEESGSSSRGYTNQGPPKGRRRATIRRALAEAIQIKGPQREGKGDKKASGSRGYANHGSPKGGKGQQ